jgi:hypothetical protein
MKMKTGFVRMLHTVVIILLMTQRHVGARSD